MSATLRISAKILSSLVDLLLKNLAGLISCIFMYRSFLYEEVNLPIYGGLYAIAAAVMWMAHILQARR